MPLIIDSSDEQLIQNLLDTLGFKPSGKDSNYLVVQRRLTE